MNTTVAMDMHNGCSSADMQNVPVEAVSNQTIFEMYTQTEFRRHFLSVPFHADKFITPIYIILGLFGNSISSVVWSRRKLYNNNSSAIYLAAVSLADLFFLQLYFLQYLERIYFLKVTGYMGICQIYQVLFLTCQYLPISLTLTFTVERWIAICYPFMRDVWCTPTRACWITIIVTLTTASVSFVNFFFWSPNEQSGLCELVATDSEFQQFYSYFEQTLMSGVLPICILGANILVIRELRKITHSSHAQLRRRAAASRNNDNSSTCRLEAPRMSNESQAIIYSKKGLPPLICDSSPNSPNAKEDSCTINKGNHRLSTTAAKSGKSSSSRDESSTFRSTTTMLVSVSFYLILCTLPSGAMLTLQHVFPSGPECIKEEYIHVHPVWRSFFICQHIKEFVDLLSATHYVGNFIIYLTTHKSYRREFLRILTCGMIQYRDRDRDEFVIPLRSGGQRGGRMNSLQPPGKDGMFTRGSSRNCRLKRVGTGPEGVGLVVSSSDDR